MVKQYANEQNQVNDTSWDKNIYAVELRFNTNLPFFASKVALYYFITDTFE
jgi:hypothetical protein